MRKRQSTVGQDKTEKHDSGEEEAFGNCIATKGHLNVCGLVCCLRPCCWGTKLI